MRATLFSTSCDSGPSVATGVPFEIISYNCGILYIAANTVPAVASSLVSQMRWIHLYLLQVSANGGETGRGEAESSRDASIPSARPSPVDDLVRKWREAAAQGESIILLVQSRDLTAPTTIYYWSRPEAHGPLPSDVP